MDWHAAGFTESYAGNLVDSASNHTLVSNIIASTIFVQNRFVPCSQTSLRANRYSFATCRAAFLNPPLNDTLHEVER